MEIEWIKDITIIVFQDEDDYEPIDIKIGEKDEVDIIGENEQIIDIKFVDGSVAFGIEKDWYTVLAYN